MSTDDATPPARPRLSRLKLILFLAAFLGTPPACWLTYEYTLGIRFAKEDCAAALAEWRAAGLPEKADFVARSQAAAVPDAENLFKQPPFEGLGATHGSTPEDWKKPRTGRWQGIQFRFTQDPKQASLEPNRFVPDDLLSQKPNIPGFPIPTPLQGISAEVAILNALEKQFPDLKTMVEVEAAHPRGAFSPVDGTKWLSANPWPDYSALRGNTQVLTVYSGCRILAAHDGRPALTTLRAVARLHAATRAMPSLVNLMMNRVFTDMAVPRLVRLGLREGVWSDAELAEIETLLGGIHFSGPLQRDALTLEAAFGGEIVWAMAEDSPEYRQRADRFPQDSDFGAASSRPNLYRSCAIHRRTIKSLIDATPRGAPLDRAAIVAAQDALTTMRGGAATHLAQLAIPAFTSLPAYCAKSDAEISLVRIAVALERYRRAHGEYPEKLDALTPDLLPAIPASPWKGGTLDYAMKPGWNLPVLTKPAWYSLTFPDSDYTAGGLGGLSVDTKHPGPWEIFGQEIKLPESITGFDTVTITRTVPTPKPIRWEMTAPKAP